MAEKLERKVMEIYGENAATRDIIAYGSDIAGNIVKTKDPDVIQTEAYKTGVRSAVVGKNSTSLQNRQALDFLFSRQLKYLYQNGIAEWGADETYFVNSLAVGSNGNLYVSLTNNNKGNNPVTDTKNWKAFPTPAQLAQKVAKAGDTMSGTLKMSGTNQLRFGTDDNYYYIKRDENNGNFLIYANNNTGLYLGGNEQHTPYYWNGTNAFRLLTTAGDTMTGPLKMSGQNQIIFGTDDNYYFIQNNDAGNFNIYHATGGAVRGLQLNASDNYAPYYKKEDNKFYRLLTTADFGASTIGENLAPDYSAAVTIPNNAAYTAPANGWIMGYSSNGDYSSTSLVVNGIRYLNTGRKSYNTATSICFFIGKGQTVAPRADAILRFVPCIGS